MRDRTLAAVALVSFASLLLELALTRLFSVVLFYHFAFLAISIALLGLGAGGVFSYLLRARLARFSLRGLGTTLSIFNALAIVGVLEVVLHTPVGLELARRNFLRLTIIYLASAVPFFFTGVLFSTLFAREHRRAATLYGADLAGGALACLAIVPLLNFIGGPNAVIAAAVAMATAGVLWSRVEDPDEHKPLVWGTRISVLLSALLVAVIAVNYHGRLIDIVYAKGMRRDKPWMLFARWNAISRVEVNQVGESKYIVIDADASSAIMNVDPKRWSEDVPATPHGTGLPEAETYNWKRDLMAAAPAIVNVLRPKGSYAIIGPGGGVDVLRAVANGSPSVTGIEINPIIADTVMRGRYADYAYHLYDLPQVHMHVSDGRSFIRASKEKYDVIEMTLVDTWASTAAGAFALSENNLYTVEAFREYFDHLKPDGIIAITRWEFAQPREALRVVTQEIEALRTEVNSYNGLATVLHFLVVADGTLDEDGRPVTVLAKKTLFEPEEVKQVLDHLRANTNLHLVMAGVPSNYRAFMDNAPWVRADALQPFAAVMVQADYDARARRGFGARPGTWAWIEEQQLRTYIRDYPYNISPVYDSAPFFFFTLKTGDVFRGVLSGSGKGMDWRINLGIVVLGLVLLISLAAVLAFLVLPLAVNTLLKRYGARQPSAGQPARGRAGSMDQDLPTANRQRPTALLYFIALGLAYILIEIAFIQRFVLFLGHPTYALTVVVFLMLLSSGAGSLAARRIIPPFAPNAGAQDGAPDIRGVRRPLAAAIVLVLLYVWLLPLVLTTLVGLPFFVKLVITAVMLVPLGFVMGMPFPTGLRALGSDSEDSLVEWAWAMNAAASVLGSVLAMIIAIHFGLNVTLALGAAAYVAAMATVPAPQRR